MTNVEEIMLHAMRTGPAWISASACERAVVAAAEKLVAQAEDRGAEIENRLWRHSPEGVKLLDQARAEGRAQERGFLAEILREALDRAWDPQRSEREQEFACGLRRALTTIESLP